MRRKARENKNQEDWGSKYRDNGKQLPGSSEIVPIRPVLSGGPGAALGLAEKINESAQGDKQNKLWEEEATQAKLLVKDQPL